MPEQPAGIAVPPADQAVMRRMVAAFAGGRFCAVELYPDKAVGPGVSRWGCYRMRPGEYRAQVMVTEGSLGLVRLVGIDGSREDCARWLRVMGVPVLRIGAATDKPF